MKTIPALLICSLLATQSNAANQKTVKAIRLTDSVSAANKVAKPSKPKKSIEILGGSPEDLVVHLHETFPEEKLWERTSFILNPDDIRLPMLRLLTSSAEEVFKVYNRLSEVRPEWGEWIWEGEFSEAASIALVDRTGASATPSSVFQQRLRKIVDGAQKNSKTVRPASKTPANLNHNGDPFAPSGTRTVRASVTPKPEPLITRVFATGTLSQQELEDLLISIEETVHLYSDLNAKRGGKPVEKPKLKYHSRTKALIAIGTASSLEIVSEIITASSKRMDNRGFGGDPFGGASRPVKPAKPIKPSDPF